VILCRGLGLAQKPGITIERYRVSIVWVLSKRARPDDDARAASVIGQLPAAAMAEAMDAIEFGERDETLSEHAKVVRTLVPSPVILDILQANLRAPDSRDIIFVKACRNTATELTLVSPPRVTQSCRDGLSAGILSAL